jgi:hypothetical protein
METRFQDGFFSPHDFQVSNSSIYLGVAIRAATPQKIISTLSSCCSNLGLVKSHGFSSDPGDVDYIPITPP